MTLWQRLKAWWRRRELRRIRSERRYRRHLDRLLDDSQWHHIPANSVYTSNSVTWHINGEPATEEEFNKAMQKVERAKPKSSKKREPEADWPEIIDE